MVLYEADFAEDTIYSFGGNFITCFSLCCIAWCAVTNMVYSMSKNGVLSLRCECEFTGYFTWPLQNVNIHRNAGRKHHHGGGDIICIFYM